MWSKLLEGSRSRLSPRIEPSKDIMITNRGNFDSSLSKELDAIYAEFEVDNREFLAPDGIQIAVNGDEDHQFSDGSELLDYDENEEESVFPVLEDDKVSKGEDGNLSDAETIEGEEIHNTSLSSSAVISFKNNNDLLIGQKNEDKATAVADMTPDELIDKNLALKELMAKLMEATSGKSIEKERKSKLMANDQSYRKEKKGKGGDQFKSPSDTTIYAPALKLTLTKEYNHIAQNNQQRNLGREVNVISGSNKEDSELMKQISQFLEQAQIENEMSKTLRPVVRSEIQQVRGRQPTQWDESTVRLGTSRNGYNSTHAQLEQADQVTQGMVRNAEWFRAATELPRGRVNVCNVNDHEVALIHQNQENVVQQPLALPGNVPILLPQNKVNSISEDESFHLTCHVHPNMRAKIQRGEFIELEKLLTRDKFRNSSSAGQRMELVSKGGETFIMPVEKDNKIMNVHKWEQAFRIYAAIYSHANRHRSAEIWQYIFVINSAASTYTWDNVASYDYMFRQLMACNPARSWANIYLQMWNLTMRDVIPKNNYFGDNSQYRKDGN